MNTKIKTKDLVLMSLFTALIITGTYIKIPLPVCPITFQPVFVTLTGIFLGGRKGAASVACYIFLGLVGLPVFTGGGGLWYVFQPTFGFLLGYIIQAFITGEIVRSGKPVLSRFLFGCFTGLIIMYVIGVPYFWIISRYYICNSMTVKSLLVNCLFIPFPKDAALCAFAAVLGKKMLPHIDAEYRRAVQ